MARPKPSFFERLAYAFGRPLPRANGAPITGGNYWQAGSSSVRGVMQHSTPTEARKEISTWERTELVRQTRALEKNAGTMRAIVDAFSTYCVGDTGIQPEAQSDDAAWNEEAEAYFNQWANRPEVTNRFNLVELQNLVCRSIDRDGEIFVVKVLDWKGRPRLQMLEGHRIGAGAERDSNDFPDGIKTDRYGRPLYYRILTAYGVRDIPANSVMHIFEPDSVSGSRGIPPHSTALSGLQDINELLNQEIKNAKLSGEVIRMVIRNSGQADDDDTLLAGGSVASPNNPADKAALDETGGITMFGSPGEEIKQIESNRPSPNLLASLDWLTRSSLSGSGIPAEFLFDPARAGGAATRLVVQRAARRFATRGRCLAHRFMTPTWGFVIGYGIKTGELRAVKNWNRVAWITPKSLTVDFARDTNANLKELAFGTRLLSDYLGETGGNLDRHLDKRGEIAAKIAKAAAKWGVPKSEIYNPLQTIVSAGADTAANIISGEAVAPDAPTTPTETEQGTDQADETPETIEPQSPTDEPI